jgi:hypothetical protein
MILTLARRWYTPDSTLGTLTVDGTPECYTLEPVVRTSADPALADAEIARVKIVGQTAIPAGTYRITIYDSPTHGRVLLLHDVPGFTDVEVHIGNTHVDTKACILVGLTREPDAVAQSKLALAALVPKIEAALARGEAVALTIRQMPAEAA